MERVSMSLQTMTWRSLSRLDMVSGCSRLSSIYPLGSLVNETEKVPAIQSLVDENEIVRNFLRDTDPS
jgi:hypothetical protein